LTVYRAFINRKIVPVQTVLRDRGFLPVPDHTYRVMSAFQCSLRACQT
jgi:hypothetical protein